MGSACGAGLGRRFTWDVASVRAAYGTPGHAGPALWCESSRPPAGPCEDRLGMLEIRSLRKSFGALVAVDDVSFTVERGQLVGLLGPNGAGKTTTVSMIAGVGRPDGGDVLIDGRRLAGDADPAKRRLGLVPQGLALY